MTQLDTTTTLIGVKAHIVLSAMIKAQSLVKGDVTMASRDEYIEKTKARIDQWNAEMDKLEARMRELDADAKIEAKERLEDMHKLRDEAVEQLREMQKAGNDAWDDLQADFDKSWEEIQSAFRSAVSRFQ